MTSFHIKCPHKVKLNYRGKEELQECGKKLRHLAEVSWEDYGSKRAVQLKSFENRNRLFTSICTQSTNNVKLFTRLYCLGIA